MRKNGHYLLIKFSLRGTLEEIAAGVFEYTGLNDEHAGVGCLYDVHCKLIIDCNISYITFQRFIKSESTNSLVFEIMALEQESQNLRISKTCLQTPRHPFLFLTLSVLHNNIGSIQNHAP